MSSHILTLHLVPYMSDKATESTRKLLAHKTIIKYKIINTIITKKNNDEPQHYKKIVRLRKHMIVVNFAKLSKKFETCDSLLHKKCVAPFKN